MAQHDYIIENQPGASFRADLNDNLAAIVTNNSGPDAPTVTYPFQWWADTTAGVLKQRDAANESWVSVLVLATGRPVGAVVQTSSTGAIIVPEGDEGQRPDEGGLRANTQSLSDYFLEYKNKITGVWDAVASRLWVKAITDPLVSKSPIGSGDAPYFGCRAWANFNGTGTVAIRASGNVTSITDHGAGDYTVNFTTPLPDGNYSAPCSASDSAVARFCGPVAFSPNGVRVRAQTQPGVSADFEFVTVAVFR